MVLGGQEENPIPGWAAQFPSRSKGFRCFPRESADGPGGRVRAGRAVIRCFDPVSLTKAGTREWSWVGVRCYPFRQKLGPRVASAREIEEVLQSSSRA